MFKLPHQLAHFSFGLACNTRGVDSSHLLRRPANGARSKAYGMCEDTLGNPKVDGAPGQACVRKDSRKTKDGVSHACTSLGGVEHDSISSELGL